MKTKKTRWGCLVVGFFILLLLMAGGGWWWFQSQYALSEGAPPSAVQVFLLSPSAGSEFQAGDVIPVEAQAVAPQAIQNVELFVDGVAYGGPVPPQRASWAWPAFPAGIHTLSARATAADGQMGQSQTVIVNVTAGDGNMQAAAHEGQTLGDVGSGFGVPPDQMAAANPNIDPGLPLPDGQPVNVPVGNPKPGGGPGGAAGGPGPSLNPAQILSITWKFTPTSPVDKSYCYTSTGNGIWEKMPKEPFEFFGGGQLEYLQENPPFSGGQMVIQMQCWGWLSGALKFLGQGEAKFDSQPPPGEMKVSGEGFVLVGIPEIPADSGGGGGLIIPPPFALREPANTAECLAHNHPILGGLVCDTLLNGNPKEYTILVWEWEPKLCLPTDCIWVNKIDGYYVYEIDPFTNQVKYLKDVTNPAQKSSAVPLPWGAKCYGVRAYVNNPAIEPSDMATYCNNKVPAVQKMTLTPTDWLTTGGDWIQDGCDDYGAADPYVLLNQDTGFGNKVGEVFVGSDIADNDDCYEEGDYSGGVKFPNPILPPGAVVQKSVLKFAEFFTDYYATGVATNYSLFCVGGVGRAKQSWTGLVTGNHFVGKNVLAGAAYYSPITSLTGWDDTPEVDVTWTVKNWISHPDQNHGFILKPLPALKPASDGSGACRSGAGDFKLEIFYFAPP